MKSAILITARLKSTRLPMKVLKDICGKPMIVHMLDRLKLATIPDDIIICTSTVEQDDPLEQIAISEGVKCFRGDPDDVLLRLSEAANEFKVETVINCTADNPFVDPIYIDKLYNYHCDNNYDFTKINGLPFGVFSYAISPNAMIEACSIKTEKDTEVWHGYFMETNHFNWGILEVDDSSIYWPELRLTVDTKEDFDLISKIFNELYQPGNVFSLNDIIDLCKSNPALPLINSDVQQKPGLPIKIKDSIKNKSD